MIDLYYDLERVRDLAQLAADDPGSYHSDIAIRELAETVCLLAIERDARPSAQEIADLRAALVVSEGARNIVSTSLIAAQETVLQLQREAIRLSAENRDLRLVNAFASAARACGSSPEEIEEIHQAAVRAERAAVDDAARHRAKRSHDEQELAGWLREDEQKRVVS